MILENKVAIVTGGSQGIGKAIALRFAKEGAKIVIANRDIKKGTMTKNEIEEFGGEAIAISTDITNFDQIKHMVDETEKIFGEIDILVNNAGLLIRSSFMNTSEKIWKKTMDTNLKGTFLCSQEVARRMISREKGGKIINITSIDGKVVYYHGNHASYGVSKAGIIMLTKGMAVELAPKNINVNAIAPGVVKTEISEGSMSNQKHLQEVLKDIPMGRLAKPEEITGAAVFLASEDANYITGTTLYVDGGWVIH